MIVILVAAVLFVAFMIWFLETNSWNDAPQMLGALISGIVLFIALVCIPLYRAQAYDQLAQRDALQATYNELRSHPSYEMATVGQDIAEWNAWLASAQYWHRTQWAWYWPEEVMSAKPIK